jgi:hypothetical protein
MTDLIVSLLVLVFGAALFGAMLTLIWAAFHAAFYLLTHGWAALGLLVLVYLLWQFYRHALRHPSR